MGWGHSDYIDLCSSIGTVAAAVIAAIAAFSSARASKTSDESTKRSIDLQHKIELDRKAEIKTNLVLNSKMRLLDQLTYDARRANSFDIVERDVDPWSGDSIANIIYSLDSARNKIFNWICQHGDNDEKYLKEFLMDQLNYRVIKRINTTGIPINCPDDDEIFELWLELQYFLKKN